MTTQKANTGNPFFDFDVAKVMAEFDPAKMAGEFAKFARQYDAPELDLDTLAESQRRNVEALAAANKTAVDGARTLAKRQSEILQQTLAAAQKAYGTLGKADTPPEAAARQVEIAKEMFEKAVANAQALTEIVAKSNADTARVINGRIAEGLDEVKALAQKLEK